MIKIVAKRASEFEGAKAHLAGMCELIASRLQASPEIQAYAIPGRDIEVSIILGGPDECGAWDEGPSTLGFYAVRSSRREDEKTGEEYYNANVRFEAHVNLDAGEAILAEEWAGMSEYDREGELENWLITPIHECLHALEWIKETGGLTPHEVYETGTETAIRDTNLAIEKRLAAGADDGEDVIEAKARAIAVHVARDLLIDGAVVLDRFFAARAVAPARN
jgi:hypothetical protein